MRFNSETFPEEPFLIFCGGFCGITNLYAWRVILPRIFHSFGVANHIDFEQWAVWACFLGLICGLKFGLVTIERLNHPAE